MSFDAPEPDIYSVHDIARAASVPVREAMALVDSGQVRAVGEGFLAQDEAVRAVRLLTGAAGEVYRPRSIFTPHRTSRTAALPFAASTALHAAMVVAIALIAALGVRGTVTEARTPVDLPRLVFLAIPGEGGGGGGGGLRQPQPPARAALTGKSALRSPVRTDPPRPKKAEQPPEPAKRTEVKSVPKPEEAPVVQPAPPVPPVEAPVASSPTDEQDRAGVLETPATEPSSQGRGNGGGAGTGEGTGTGEGSGSGIGPGEGGGTGGGPYRPGSGIAPPALLREVKPQYTEDARRRGVEGDVVLEIVVRADGTVGEVTVLQRLGSGLDQRAVDAVRQWRFAPARRFGTPVDVLVEVAVEFKLR